MANDIRFKVRSDTTAAFEANDTLLIQDEVALDTTSKRFKVGDGVTSWKNLSYVKPDVIDDLTTGGQNDALSAEQGVRLKELIEGKADTTTVNNLEQSLTEQITTLRTDMENSSFVGADGKAATIEITKVTTGEPDTNASVTNVGTENAAKLEITIPRGAKGDKGDTGATGPQGATGATGAQGATGATGATPTISIGTVSTGAAGSNASASITGTSPNLKLNLTIPRGNTGATGASGTSGYSTETWTFTLSSGSTVNKKVVLS